MRAVLQTLDPVVLTYAANVLEQEGIESVIFDAHASVMDGSMGFLPRRLMVLEGISNAPRPCCARPCRTRCPAPNECK
jgi:hypothetical protein